MQHHSFHSPLRYPGGKGSLANYIKQVLELNGLVDGHYVEVYAGGAGIAWSLLFQEYVRHVHINDISRPIYSFWATALNETDALCRLITDTPVTMEQWARQKKILAELDCHTQTEIGFATFFLNRTNRSGIIAGGVIGGKEQAGTWKLDARFNKKDLVARIQRIACYKSRITLHNKNAADFLRDDLPSFPKRTFIYLDPPYYVKGQGLYEDYYLHRHHVEIAELMAKCVNHPWLVSYDAAPEILSLYKEQRSIRYSIHYSAQQRYAGSEVMFFSKNLTIPSSPNPIRAKAKPQIVHDR